VRKVSEGIRVSKLIRDSSFVISGRRTQARFELGELEVKEFLEEENPWPEYARENHEILLTIRYGEGCEGINS
jgi:hypothetical protein